LRKIQKEKKQMEIKAKMIERGGYEVVFSEDGDVDEYTSSEYNSIKESISSKLRN
jgi:hypothetical protein